MPETDPAHDGALSRRGLLGAAAALGVGTVMAVGATPAHALPNSAPLPIDALGTFGSALTFVGYPSTAFFPYSDPAITRTYLNGSIQPNPVARWISVPLSLAAGSVIRQIHVSYEQTPVLAIRQRSLTSPDPDTQHITLSLTGGTGALSQTVDLDPEITIAADSTYTLEFFCSAGNRIYGAVVGYVPPTQGFVPFSGTPRVLDTRDTGGKLAAGEERTVALGFPGARSAVLNVTVADTEGAGFLAVFQGGIAWPNNSTLNWDRTGQLLSNGVVVALDAAGHIVIRAGANRTNVIIDRIGWLL